MPFENSDTKNSNSIQHITRPAILAGSWYPENPEMLKASVEKMLAEAVPSAPLPAEQLQAIVVPHAGHAYSGRTAAAAFRTLDRNYIHRVFILCPNHRVAVYDAVIDNADEFETPLGKIPVDRELLSRWQKNGIVRENHVAHAREHAIEIELPFLQTVLDTFSLVPIIVGQLTEKKARKLAAALSQELKPGDLLVISTDLVHFGEPYGFVPFRNNIQENLKLYDQKTYESVSSLNSDVFRRDMTEREHMACGAMSLWVMTMLFEQQGSRTEKLDYTTSGAITGDFDMSVSYMAMRVSGKGFPLNKLELPQEKAMNEIHILDADEQGQALKLARLALETGVKARRRTPFDQELILANGISLSSKFDEEHGVFVTLNEDGELRGCIGNILPQARLAEGIWGRAQDAALGDPRFEDVTPEELPYITLDISILSVPAPVPGYRDIVIGKHGMILKKHGRMAVFLPQVAPEQGWNIEQTLTALSRKAGLAPNAWQEGAEFDVFEAQVIEEKE